MPKRKNAKQSANADKTAIPVKCAVKSGMHLPLPAVLIGLGLLAAPAVGEAGTAVDDHYSIPFNSALTSASVIDNDLLNGNTFSVFQTFPAAHGAVSLQTTGNLTYTPDPGYHGEDSFGYRLVDGNSSNATVFISIADPVAVPGLAPAGLAALSVGLAGLALRRRRNKT